MDNTNDIINLRETQPIKICIQWNRRGLSGIIKPKIIIKK
jgi:hypothetical protein